MRHYILCALLIGFLAWSGGMAMSTSQNDLPISVSIQEIPTQVAGELEFEVIILNQTSEPIYIPTNTYRTDGSIGPYFSIREDDNTVLLVAWRFYSPAKNFTLIIDHAGAQLKLLPPNESTSMRFKVSFPLVETMPPYGDGHRRNVFDRAVLRKIQAEIGVVPTSEGLQQMVRSKQDGSGFHALSPAENAESGKRIYEVQQLCHSEQVELR